MAALALQALFRSVRIKLSEDKILIFIVLNSCMHACILFRRLLKSCPTCATRYLPSDPRLNLIHNVLKEGAAIRVVIVFFRFCEGPVRDKQTNKNACLQQCVAWLRPSTDDCCATSHSRFFTPDQICFGYPCLATQTKWQSR